MINLISCSVEQTVCSGYSLAEYSTASMFSLVLLINLIMMSLKKFKVEKQVETKLFFYGVVSYDSGTCKPTEVIEDVSFLILLGMQVFISLAVVAVYFVRLVQNETIKTVCNILSLVINGSVALYLLLLLLSMLFDTIGKKDFMKKLYTHIASMFDFMFSVVFYLVALAVIAFAVMDIFGLLNDVKLFVDSKFVLVAAILFSIMFLEYVFTALLVKKTDEFNFYTETKKEDMYLSIDSSKASKSMLFFLLFGLLMVAAIWAVYIIESKKAI
jgi:hypothetical protein